MEADQVLEFNDLAGLQESIQPISALVPRLHQVDLAGKHLLLSFSIPVTPGYRYPSF